MVVIVWRYKQKIPFETMRAYDTDSETNISTVVENIKRTEQGESKYTVQDVIQQAKGIL